MGAQSKIKTLLICLLSLFTTAAYSEDIPDLITKTQSLCPDVSEVKEQGLEVIETNAQFFYALFTPHLSIQLKERILELLPLLFDKSKSQEAMLALLSIFVECSHIAEAEKSDVSIITKLLKSRNTQLQWIGIELSEEELKEDPIQVQIEGYTTLKQGLSLFGLDDLLYLIFDNHIIALAEHPELFEGIAWVPLDDNTKNAKSFIEVIENILEEISQLMPQRAADLNHIVFTAIITDITKIPTEQISDELSKIENTEMRALAATLFEHTNQFIEEIQKRDKTMASTALRQTGNGLILLGPLHLKGVTQHLRSAK